MLLQTVKSRNVWLWGKYVETIKYNPYTELISDKQEVTIELENTVDDLRKTTDLMNDTVGKQKAEAEYNSKFLSKKAQGKQDELNKINEKINEKIRLGDRAIERQGSVKYTTPFKLTVVDSIKNTWQQSVGETIGLTSNFLQSWHVKPVTVQISGLSYFGSWGGSVVDQSTLNDLTEQEKKESSVLSKINKTVTGAVNSANTFVSSLGNTVQDLLNRDNTNYDNYDLVIDDDIAKINDILSIYGEGVKVKSSAIASAWTYLLIDNDPAASANSYSVYIGHITDFSYDETTDKPFIYKYNLTFKGMSLLNTTARAANLKAEADKDAVKVSIVTQSDGSTSLGYAL